MHLFFLDIDGTICVPGTDPSPELIDVIAKLQKKGDKVFLCTGRNYCFVPESVHALHCDGGIYSAGGSVLIGDREIFNKPLSPEQLQEILPAAEASGITFTLECLDTSFKSPALSVQNMLSPEDWENMHSELKRLIVQDSNGTYLHPYSEYDGRPVYKLSFIAFSQEQIDTLSAGLPDWAKVTIFRNLIAGFPFSAGEVSDKRINKGLALLKVCEEYGAVPADCIAYGDSMNDAEVIIAAGTGYAMGQSTDDVKAIADKVCGRCDENGLAYSLAEYL